MSHGRTSQTRSGHPARCDTNPDSPGGSTPEPKQASFAASAGSGISRSEFLIGSVASAALAMAVISPVRAAEPRKVRVGMILPEDGPYAPEAKSILAGFDLYLKEKGSKAPALDVLKRDPGPTDEKTVEALTELAVNKEVDFLIGPPTPDGSERVIQGLAETKSILFVTSPAVRLVAGEFCSSRIFRVRPNTYQAAYPLVPWALKTMGLRVFLTGDDDRYGNEQVDAFAHGCEKSGGLFVDRIMAPNGSKTLANVVEAIAASQPDFVFAAFRQASAVAFLKAIRTATPPVKTPILGPESLTAFPGVLSAAGKQCLGVKTLTTMKNPQEFNLKIKHKLKREATDATRAAEGYDLAALICQIAPRMPEDRDPEKLAQMIQEMTIDGPRGRISFDANHEPVLEVAVREWVPSGQGFKQNVIENLGTAASVDFGCGKVGFPKNSTAEPRDETPERAPEEDMIWDGDNG